MIFARYEKRRNSKASPFEQGNAPNSLTRFRKILQLLSFLWSGWETPPKKSPFAKGGFRRNVNIVGG